MTPILYASSETSFAGLGIGALVDAITCKVTEERNGIYELVMTYPVTGKRYADLVEERIIYALPHERAASGQPFRIYKITRPLNGIITIYAEHVSYQLNSLMFGPNKLASSLTEAIGLLGRESLPSNSFTFTTYKTSSGSWRVNDVRSVMSCLKGEKDSILDAYGGGEYEFDAWAVKLYENRGSDRGVVISYGRNLIDIEKESDISGVITGMRPWWKDENDIYYSLPDADPIVYNSHYTNYVYPRIQAIDLSNQYEEGLSYNQMCTRAENYCLNYMNDNSTWTLPANIRVKTIALWQTDEYKNEQHIAGGYCGLCDTVTVRYEALGIETKAKVISVIYDVLSERNVEIEIGEKRENLNDLIRRVVKGDRT